MSGDYRDLIVWQKSYALALGIYKATQSFPKSEIFGLTSQSRRAAVSIPANIAEGNCRHSRGDYLYFLSVARGSAGELDTLVRLARDLSCLDDAATQQLMDSLSEVRRMLTRLAQSLRPTKS